MTIIPATYQSFIASARVSSGTREVLQARGIDDDPGYQPVALTAAQLTTLRAVIDRAIPQRTEARIDLAARLDALLAGGKGDGWRFARLPPDRTAYAINLSALDQDARATHGHAFADLAPALQDAILTRAAAGALDGERMQLWFQDLMSDAVRLYMAHPATLARVGYSGIGYGGDGDGKPGFTLTGLGEREPWEPTA